MAYYKKYLDYFFKKTSGKVKWGYFIFFVTNKCNAKCKHCFYWKKLNSNLNELTLNEIASITKNLGGVQVLLLSGGEPFLREDLFEIVSLFIKNNKVKVVSIPTNAILTEQIIKTTKKLSTSFPNILFSVNPSIDNLYIKNDEIRGVKGAFKKSIRTLKELEKIRREKKNVEIVINTTISNFNYKDFDEIANFFKEFNITYHNFELLRGSPKEKNINLPPLSEIKKIHSKVIRLREYYINKNNRNSNFLNRLIEKVSVLGVMKYTQKLKEEVLIGKKLPFICSAGQNIIVLEPAGEVKLCELYSSVGNLRDYNYNMNELLTNEKSKKMFEIAKKCKCTHICFLNMSIANDKKSLIKVPYYFFKRC
ncbi:MAG: radical SAM protein [Nanoarchaeota archaeon]|nr:radical SAM protein [Nanoarchaeota archaeon]